MRRRLHGATACRGRGEANSDRQTVLRSRVVTVTSRLFVGQVTTLTSHQAAHSALPGAAYYLESGWSGHASSFLLVALRKLFALQDVVRDALWPKAAVQGRSKERMLGDSRDTHGEAVEVDYTESISFPLASS